METERIEVPGGYEVGRNGELLFNGYRGSVWKMKNF